MSAECSLVESVEKLADTIEAVMEGTPAKEAAAGKGVLKQVMCVTSRTRSRRAVRATVEIKRSCIAHSLNAV